MRTLTVALAMAMAIAVVAWPQHKTRSFPEFKDYPAGAAFKGKPAPPNLVRPADRLFRTKIREGAAKGPDFAGHFSIAQWGCGTACISFAIVDAKTGAVYDPPFRYLAYGAVLKYADVSEDDYQELEFNLDSRLLIMRGCPEDQNCGSYFYAWDGSNLKLIRKAVAVEIAR